MLLSSYFSDQTVDKDVRGMMVRMRPRLRGVQERVKKRSRMSPRVGICRDTSMANAGAIWSTVVVKGNDIHFHSGFMIACHPRCHHHKLNESGR